MITVEQPVRAAPAAVWAYVSRLADWGELLPTVDRVTPLAAPGPPALGSRYAVEQPRLPRLVYEVTAWVPGERFTWVAAAAGVRTVGTHEVSPARDGTTVLRLGLGWEGPFRPVVGLLFTRLSSVTCGSRRRRSPGSRRLSRPESRPSRRTVRAPR